MKKSIRIGLLGGSFNPPHEGHLHISQIALRKLKLTKITWLVSPRNPLKDNAKLESLEGRLKKAKLLTKKYNNIVPSDIENNLFSKNEKKYYTYNFLKKFQRIHPEYRLFFIIGADNLINFHKWYKNEEILDICDLVVFDRGKEKYKAIRSKTWLRFNHKINFINSRKIDISSTQIRKANKLL